MVGTSVGSGRRVASSITQAWLIEGASRSLSLPRNTLVPPSLTTSLPANLSIMRIGSTTLSDVAYPAGGDFRTASKSWGSKTRSVTSHRVASQRPASAFERPQEEEGRDDGCGPRDGNSGKGVQ